MPQTRVGWRSGQSQQTVVSSLWTSIYAVYNADTLGTSLDTSIYGVYNGDNANDTSGNGRNGTNVNNVTFTTGKVGNAFTFNGSNYISLPNSSFDFNGDFSISCWVKIPSNPSVVGYIFSNDNYDVATLYGYGLLVNPNRTIRFYIGTSLGTSTVISTTALVLNTWYHITVKRDSVAKRSDLYINGVFEAQATNTNITIQYSGGANPRAIQPTIGANRGNNQGVLSTSNYLNGSVDALTIWNKKLSDNEITSLYNSGTGAEYPFSSQTLATYNDALGNYNGTQEGGVAFTTGKIGKAFQFDGINDYVRLPNNSMDLTGDFSISMWANWGRNNTSQILIANLNSNYELGFFVEHAASQLRFRGYKSNLSNAFYVVKSSYTPTLNTWYHYTFTHKNGVNNIYENGILIATDTSTTGHVNHGVTNYPTIGANKYNSSNIQEPFLGSIDALNVWSKELTQSEITELYNSGNGKQYPN